MVIYSLDIHKTVKGHPPLGIIGENVYIQAVRTLDIKHVQEDMGYKTCAREAKPKTLDAKISNTKMHDSQEKCA